MNIAELREVIDIVAKRAPDREKVWPLAGADHDIIYLLLMIDNVSEDSEDGERLKELGCHVENEEGWAFYV